MANLSSSVEIVQKRPNNAEIAEGRKYESRLRLFTLPMGSYELRDEHAWRETLNGLTAKLTTEKFNAITKYTTTPLPIVSISENIMLDIYKVFEGRNASFSVDYPHERIQEAASAMLDELDVRNWIEQKGKVVLKCAPNTVAVVDKDDNGDPKLLAISNDKIVGYETDKYGKFTVFCFIHSKGVDPVTEKQWTKYAVYDTNSYRVVLEEQGNLSEILDAPHNLGYCPARFFYDDPLTTEHRFNRAIPLSVVRGVMKQWNQINLYEYYQDNFAAFQIMQYPDDGCDMGCDNGKIYNEPILDDDNQVSQVGYYSECPSCANKQVMGPGTMFGVEVALNKEDQDTRDTVKFIAPDIPSLEYTGKKQDSKENFIKQNTVGYNSALSTSAMNEQQVMAIVESRKKPLLNIAGHLNELYIWLVETAVKVTYDVDVTVHANFGTEFFILGEKDILDLIKSAKLAGVQSTEIQQLNRQLIETKYKTSPHLVQKMLITADVEPNAYDTQEEVRKKFLEGMVTREDYYIKCNFTDLIGRFVRENGSVVTFGKELTYDKKIERIKETLLFYTNQKLPKDEAGADDSAEPTGASDTRAE